MFSKLFAVTVLATAASAHMKITSPVPYGSSDLDNSPLFANGTNFPCKLRGNVYNLEGASNVFAQGSTQKLAFLGSVVHGGGSCQVSVTTDAQPDKNSVWKVIKSIEGGCPAKDQVGNMPGPASTVDPYTYEYTIPKELQSGNYTLAWTWFNKIGNREMYMNCAPLTVTGSGGSKDFLNTLPDMHQANFAGAKDCGTDEGHDLLFPTPGNDVDKFNGATEVFLGPTCIAPGTPNPTNGGSGSGSAPTSSPPQPTQVSVPSAGGVFITRPPASLPAATQPAASQPAASQPAASEPVVTSAPVASSPAQSQAAPSPTSAAAALPPAPSSGSNASSGSSPSGGFAAGTACPTEGQWNCIDGTHFQRCASGSWSASQAVADGTSCQSGQAENLKMVAKRGKKSMRRAVRMRA
ncbi:hypothetical protein TRIATDRAFT_302363 [Trichoderma atroviride IMI 206040]|uniref:Lytic polysaccharide monooxygenase n=1 Tax=Hypocrea atroviridis (strain ATCC 20476 / IMI 206040) TaxID=452589 RepID=G9P586_HYPAI|nr:uncharacterized protein TRIATDRAFT_302363 [Trichoderma atroviride IMI 206040]EHK42112.1 hypothetical protein TRIATDRAFT_302363 [Trichoderma atroviride IMI 206040]